MNQIDDGDVSLTPLTAADFEPLASVARQIWLEHYITIITAAQIEYMLSGRFTSQNLQRYIGAQDKWLYVLRVSGRLVGYCSFARTTSPDEIKLEQLYVLPAFHGRGLGKRMLRFVELESIARGCRTLMLQVNKQNTKSIDVYRRGGFRVREEVVVDIGNGFVMDDFIMEKALEPRAA
jgi:diamine N-acetyltransferase